MSRRFLLPFLALFSALWMLGEPAASALTERTLTIDAASYDPSGYEASTKSIVITYTISESQSSGSLSFSSSNTDVCTIAQTINSGRYSRTEATVTFVRGGSCTLTISVGAWSTYTGASGSITFPITDPGSAVLWGSSIASPVSYGGVLKDLTVTDIDTGGLGMSRTTCAIADGRAYCWGDNGAGQLGINSTSDSNQPVAVHTVGDGTGSALPDDAEVRAISVSVSGHVCVTAMPAGGTSDADMRAYCWGRNTNGQLGDGTQINRTVPVEVDDCDCGATLISAGYDHTCAVIGGHAACWGYGSKGQIGDGLTADSAVPAYVAETGDGDRGGVTSALPTGAEITMIEAGGDASCAVADGRAYCWGNNANGRLGDGTATNRLVPVAVDLTTGLSTRTVTDIALGGRHSMGDPHSGSWMFTCAVASGDAYCWGSDGWDAIGNGGDGGGYRPIAVYTSSQGSALPDDAEVTAIDAGWRHVCAVADGVAYCWGAGTDKPGEANVSAGSALRGNHITKISVTGSQSGTSHMTTNAAVRQFVRADQTITFPTPARVDHTTASVDLTGEATASSGLAVTLTADPADVCTIAGEVVTVVSHGSCTITADQAGDGDWAPAPSVVRVLSISAPTTTTSSTTTSTSTTSSTTTTVATTTTSSTSTTTTPTSSSTSSTAPEVSSTTTQPEPSTTSTTIEEATTASVSGPLLVAEGTDGSVAIAVAVDARNRVVAPDVDGTFRLPGGASLDIVAGPYESADVVAILRAIDETATDAELERLSRSCRIHVEIPEDAEGEWILEILVDGETVISIPILMADSRIELVEATADGVLEALSLAVDHLETGGDGPSLVQIASSDQLPTQVDSTSTTTTSSSAPLDPSTTEATTAEMASDGIDDSATSSTSLVPTESTVLDSASAAGDIPGLVETLPSTGFSLVGSTFFGVLWLIAGASLLVARRR